MKKTSIKILLVAAMAALGINAYAQKSYDELSQITRLNRGISGLRSMNDGEHYTVSRGGAIIRHSYADEQKCDTLFKGRFGSYDFSNDEQFIILSENFRSIYRHSAYADYRIVKSSGGEMVAELKDVRDLNLSPDSKMVAFAKQNNLYYAELGGEPKAITTDGEWNKIINGTADWVYEEEYGFTKAYAFSPDSKQIAYLRFDESKVPTFEMMRFDGELYNKPYSFKYPKAGDTNSTVELWLYDIATGQKSRIDTGKESDQYIPFVEWTPDGELYFFRINRKQNHLEIVLCRKDGSQKVIYDEQSPTYVERPALNTIRFIDGDRFLVQNETSTGWNHIYLYSVTRGLITPLTSGEWQVTSIVETTPKNIYYISTERSPLCRDLYVIDYKGGSNGKGKLIRTLVENPELAERLKALPRKELFTFTTERGDKLNAYIIKPLDFDPAKKYPVLLTQYSGPGSQSVADSFGMGWENVMVGNGYIVACCDGRGTGYMGEKFKKQTYGNLGALEVEDQISFARHLASQEWVDGSRIGIYGWSYGGFMALGCALKGEGLFKMAIAVAPVTSWRYYDTIYTEIYNDLPQNNPKGYDDNSPINFANLLSERTKLLIMHGTADDNVHVQNTMEMCHALNRAGKHYDMMIYPDQNHSMYPSYSRHIREKMISYTLQNL